MPRAPRSTLRCLPTLLALLACACAQGELERRDAVDSRESESAVVRIPGRAVFFDEGGPAAGQRIEVFAVPIAYFGQGGELLLATTTDSQGEFELLLPARHLQDSRILASAWSEECAGFLDWTFEHLWEIEQGQLPPLRIPVYPTDGELVLRTANRAGDPLAGVRLLCTPAWDPFGILGLGWELRAQVMEPFCRRVGLIATSDEDGLCRFTGLPRGDPEDTVQRVSNLAPEFVSAGSYFEGWPDEPYVGEFAVERLADLSLGGRVLDENGAPIEGGTVSVNGEVANQFKSDGRWEVRGDQLGLPGWSLAFDAPDFVPTAFPSLAPKDLLHPDATRWNVVLKR